MLPVALAAWFLLGSPLAAWADGPVRVQTGDTLTSISLAHYGDAGHAAAIASYNGLTDSDKVYAGQVLKLPDVAAGSPSVKAAPSSEADKVHVQPGDTLSSLSLAHYGDIAHIQAIASANGLDDQSHVEAGKTLVMPHDPAAKAPVPSEQRGVATWYGPGFEGKITKCGQVYHQWDLSAASNDLPCGTVIEVTNLDNDRRVVVPVTDTGAFRHPDILDLSRGAFASVASTDTGVIPVHLSVRSIVPAISARP
jgi:rare lipoprotein A (peptidoglycan hydrolase)